MGALVHDAPVAKKNDFQPASLDERHLREILDSAGISHPTKKQKEAAWRVAHALRLLALIESRKAGVRLH